MCKKIHPAQQITYIKTKLNILSGAQYLELLDDNIKEILQIFHPGSRMPDRQRGTFLMPVLICGKL